MTEKRLLEKDSLPELLNHLKDSGRKIIAPVKSGEKFDFKEVADLDEISDDYIQTAQSAKFVFFPKVEELFSFKKNEEGTKVVDRDENSIPETVLFGLRPCDAAGILSLSAIFNWDYKDNHFNRRLEKTTIIGMSCASSDDACFCTSLGGGPGDTRGMDILLTKLTSGDYLAEILTDKGNKILKSNVELFKDATNAEEKEKNLAKVKVVFKAEEIAKKLAKAFDKEELWIEQSLRCLGCGTCAYVCPVCACFDIQDEGSEKNGKRLRCWDTCGLSQFTIHTSGHNPREAQNQRWRQRIMHKFSYMPDRLSVLGCIGCGRCSRSCPVDMNILEHLEDISEAVK